MSTTRDRIAAIAQGQGWTVADHGNRRVGYVKGELRLFVNYDARGGITGGEVGTGGRRIEGRAKLEQVIRLLSRWTP